jgi:putative ABC transport system ATP-binding protein
MRTINETDKTTFVFSTHDAHIMNEAKRIVRIMDGRIVDQGNGAEG